MVTKHTTPKKKPIREPKQPVAAKNLKRTFWDDLIEIGKRIPNEELERMPHDGAMNHDHYISGGPRKYCPECGAPYHDMSKCPALTGSKATFEELVANAGLPAPNMTLGEYPSIGQFAIALGRTLSPRDRAKFPIDGADEHDHYIYGSPKRRRAVRA